MTGWFNRLRSAADEIKKVVHAGETFILVDQDKWGSIGCLADRHRIPFLERDGVYNGQPKNSEEAIRELDRLRATGANFIAFVWSSFWWLEYYERFHTSLCSRFRCVLENERLVVFDLNQDLSARGNPRTEF